MKFSFIAVVLLFADVAVAAPPPLPEFVQSYIEHNELQYELPRGQIEPYTRSWLQEHGTPEPWAIDADFNGDDVIDWAGLLRRPDGRLDMLVVLSADDSYSHTVLTSPGTDTDEIDTGVFVEPPGEISGFPIHDEEPDPVVVSKFAGIHLVWFEKASVLYYWNDGSFSEFVTSD